MLKITPGLNLFIKISAIILFFVLIANSVIIIGIVRAPWNSELIFYAVTGVLSVIQVIYIIGVLRHFDEKKYIVVAYTVYTILEVIRRSETIIFTQTHNFGNIIPVVLGIITFFVTIYLFMTTLFIRSRVVFPGCLLFTSSLVAMLVLKLGLTLILPYLYRSDFLSIHGAYHIRRIIDGIEMLSVLLPVAVFILTNRVGRYLKSLPAPSLDL